MNLNGKVVLIISLSSGISAGAAVKFAKLGADVVINGRNKERLEKVAAEIAKVSPKKEKGVFQVIADVTKSEDCERLIKSSVEHFGKLDILVNNTNAGALSHINDPKIMELYDKYMDIDLKSAVHLTHLAVPHLEKTKGNIINISSIGSFLIFPQYFVYSIAKTAMNMFTRCMAVELGPKGIRVNTINFSGFLTSEYGNAPEISKEMHEKLLEHYTKVIPLRRVMRPEDVANSIAFIASDDASFITGINLVVDGGEMWLYPTQIDFLKP